MFTVALHEYVVESVELAGLIAAHGDTTASSIAKVVNQACGTFVFEAIDMPMDSSFDAMIDKVRSYLEDIPGGRGVDSAGRYRFSQQNVYIDQKQSVRGSDDYQ